MLQQEIFSDIMDYYPFGMVTPGRSFAAGSGYRFGFQRQEIDHEIKGDDNSVNYRYRMHDPRVGRFFAVDPLTFKYPHYSPYQFSGNRVIDRIELEGLETAFTIQLDRIQSDPVLSMEYVESMRPLVPYAIGVTVALAVVTTGGLAIMAYGTEATVAFVLEEGIEYVFEEATGIPVILDPVDMFEQFAKKGIKKMASDVIVEGRKFVAGTDVSTIQKWAYNVKTFGKELAEKYSKGEITRGQMKEAAFKGMNTMPSGSNANHIFSSKPRKFIDTEANRTMITDLANDQSKYIGIDEYGKRYFATVNADGTQTYVYTQDGIIKGAGYNSEEVDLAKTLNLKKL